MVVRIEAAPISPSDLALLLGPADVSQAKLSGEGAASVLRAPASPGALKALPGRVGVSLSVGNEGAGTVIAACSSSASERLMGKRVAVASTAVEIFVRGALPYSTHLSVNQQQVTLCIWEGPAKRFDVIIINSAPGIRLSARWYEYVRCDLTFLRDQFFGVRSMIF